MDAINNDDVPTIEHMITQDGIDINAALIVSITPLIFIIVISNNKYFSQLLCYN